MFKTMLLYMQSKVREYDQEIPQSHTAESNPWHREEEPQNIYSNNTSLRQ